jgi:hypothetical protein
MRIRPAMISAAFALGLAALPLSTAQAQPYPPQYYPCSPFLLAWPFCVAGAVVGTAAMLVTAPLWVLTGPPPAYYWPPLYRPPPPYFAPEYNAPPNYYGRR